jgi:hypothetical protein
VSLAPAQPSARSAPLPESIFDVPLSELTLDALERFLASADPEPLLWAATAGPSPRAEPALRHVSGLANGAGGWLIVGAEKQSGRWRATGADFGDRDAREWLDEAVARLRPPPPVAVKVLEAGAGRRVAVVRVDPIAVPPCVTPGGGVYQRVAGETVPVRAPVVVMDLVRRGQAALERARGAALTNSEELLAEPPAMPPARWVSLPSGHRSRTPTFALSVAAAGGPADIEARPFRERFADLLIELAQTRLQPEPHVPMPYQSAPRPYFSQDQLQVSLVGADRGWALIANRAGVVSLVYFLARGDVSLDALLTLGGDREAAFDAPGQREGDGPLARAWRTAGEVLLELGCAGPSQMAAVLDGTTPRLAGGPDRIRLERGTPKAMPSGPDFSALARELKRAVGRPQLEPDAD